MTTISTVSPYSRALWYWPIAILVMAQVGLYTAFASRGFEFTDEAYYVLNALYWREFTAVYTIFGVYAQLLLQLSDGSLAIFRMMTLISLAGSGAFLGNELQKFANSGRANSIFPIYLYWLLGTAGGMYFFGVLSTLRAPSYNTIALSAAIAATGLLLRGVSSILSWNIFGCAIAYGFFMGICGLCKGSTGFLVGCVHLAFFVCANPIWNWQRVRLLLSGVIVGLALQLALITSIYPKWWSVLQAGAALFSYDTGGKLNDMFKLFSWELQRVLFWSPVALIGLSVWGFLLRSLTKKNIVAPINWMVVLAFAITVSIWLFKEQVRFWWPAALLLSIALLIMQVVVRPRPVLERADWNYIILGMLFFSLPFAFSFGTSMSVLWHSQKAAVFVILFLAVLLERLWQHRHISKSSAVLALCFLCIPPLGFQLRAVFDHESVYRLSSSLKMQSHSWTSPVGVISVDNETRESLASLQGAAQIAGLQKGQPLIDFTGDGPGLVLALSGRPLGVPWLVGGSKDSPQWAQKLISGMSLATLSSAWLITSPDNLRSINNWKIIMEAKLGPSSHELAATMTIGAPWRWGKHSSPTITLCLWRPRGTTVIPPVLFKRATIAADC